MRLQKLLSHIGVGSRRQIEELIKDKQIYVNGQLAILGQQVTSHERITVRGQPIAIPQENTHATRVLLYNKLIGEICTRRDEEKRPLVFAHLPKLHKQRWVAVGRLDINTSGLLLFTTNGELANRLMHPRYAIERCYAVRVLGHVTAEALQRLQQGVPLDGQMAAFNKIEAAGGSGANQWYHVSLQEGRQREVRRLWESQGLTVSRLIRIRYAHLTLPRDLRGGKSVELAAEDIKLLCDAVGLTLD